MALSRLQLLVGKDGLRKLAEARVLLLGVGGVGSWAAEMLVRSGVGHLTIVDFDVVSVSNLNRQLLALHSTLGRPKVDVMSERLKDISPELDLNAPNIHLTAESIVDLLASQSWDYVVDAIDERQPKLAALVYCVKHGVPVVSSMGAANKLSSEGVTIVDISETSGCHLARLIRKSLHKQGIETGIPVVFSPALPVDLAEESIAETPGERRPLGTIGYLPAIFGCKCAEKVITDLLATN